MVAGAIRLFTRSPWSHAFVVVSDRAIVEATPHGARIAALTDYNGSLVAFNDEEPKDDAQRHAIVDAARKMIGTRYGFADIAALGLVGLGVRFRWLDRRVGREDRLICSQLVARAYAAAGLYLFDDRPAQAVTPGDLGLRLAIRPWEHAK